MTTRSLYTCTTAIALLVTIAAPGAQQQPSRPMLIRAGRVLDVRAGAYRAAAGIWIEGGLIRQIGAFDDVRAGAPKDVAVVDIVISRLRRPVPIRHLDLGSGCSRI